jgi:hypothetical protein
MALAARMQVEAMPKYRSGSQLAESLTAGTKAKPAARPTNALAAAAENSVPLRLNQIEATASKNRQAKRQRFGPKRSALNPANGCMIAYAMKVAENIRPISSGPMPSEALMSKATTGGDIRSKAASM